VPDRSLPAHKRIYRIFVAAGKEFGEDKATRMAAALSFYTLFSLVPFLFLAVAIVGFLYEDSILTQTPCSLVDTAIVSEASENPLDRLILQVKDVAGEGVADELATLTCEANVYRQGFLLVGIGLAAFSGSGIFLHVQGVLNQLFHVPEERVRGLVATIRQRAVALGAALVLAVLVLAPLVAVAGVNFIRDLTDVSWIRRTVGIAVPLTSLLLLITVVTLTFRWLTRAKIPWQAARRGGAFTALSGLAGAFLVGLYLSRAGTGGALGAVGGAAVLLFFFNLMWIIFLFGAEVTKVYADFLAYGDVLPPSHRPGSSAFEPADVREGEPSPTRSPRAELPARTGIVAFVVGLVVGWFAGRRDS